jgi:hypothetical protein
MAGRAAQPIGRPLSASAPLSVTALSARRPTVSALAGTLIDQTMRLRTVLALVSACVAVAVTGCGSRVGHTPWFGALAGYFSQSVPVHSVEASWSVPRISAGSPAGAALTWIGVQDRAIPDAESFIQVGLLEQRYAASNKQPARSFYCAFTSTSSNFDHPDCWFDVRPGDEIFVRLSQKARYWLISITDRTSGASERIDVDSGEQPEQPFGQAEWVHENPTTLSGRRYSYPELGPVRFHNVLLNGLPPADGSVFSTAMDAGDLKLAPTPISGDTFALTPLKLSAFAIQYLQTVRPTATTMHDFRERAAHWTPSTPSSQIAAQTAPVASSVAHEIDGLLRNHWPAAIHGLIGTLIFNQRTLLSHIRRVAQDAAGQPSLWLGTILRNDADSAIQTETFIQNALGLPDRLADES